MAFEAEAGWLDERAEGGRNLILRLFRRARPPAGEPWEEAEEDGPLDVALPGEGPAAAPRAWPRERLRLAEALWGEGFTGPFGAGVAGRLAAGLGLDASMTLLYLGAGLGGGARELAQASGVWVSAYEASAELADLAMERSFRARLTKKAPVSPFDPETATFRRHGFHHALVTGVLSRTAGRERLVGQLAGALRPGGQLVLVDLVAGAAGAGEAGPRALPRAGRAKEPAPWTEAETRAALAAAGFEVEAARDVSAVYRRRVLAGWGRFLGELGARRGALRRPAARRLVVRECEAWVGRLKAIEEGAVRIVCVRAVRRPEPDSPESDSPGAEPPAV
ncbi:MAG: hypothetical protein HY521_14815 [Proteobacteria bacterium]|nr:hypothetical protein [Pseudomonadota bacterium]